MFCRALNRVCVVVDAMNPYVRAAAWRGMLLAGVGSLLLGVGHGQTPSPAPAPERLAVIDGEPVTEDQLPPEAEAQLQRMMDQVYSVRLRALRSVLDQRLFEAEAKKRGVTTDALYQSEIVAKVPDPTEDEVQASYAARMDIRNKPYAAVKDQVRQSLKDLAIQKARAAYMDGLLQRAVNDGELSILLTPPKIDFSVDAGRLRGDAKAPITIIEFSDFSCVFCRRAEATVAAILAKYPGKVQFGYRDMPLTELHPHAEMAAEASRCAEEQGKFWEYHDLLFAAPDKQDQDGLLEQASALKLDRDKFGACLSSGRYKPQVAQDLQLGTRVGVVATPGFFINGVFVNGAQPLETFEAVIDRQLLAASSKQGAKP